MFKDWENYAKGELGYTDDNVRSSMFREPYVAYFGFYSATKIDLPMLIKRILNELTKHNGMVIEGGTGESEIYEFDPYETKNFLNYLMLDSVLLRGSMSSRVDDIDDVDEFLAQIESDPERIFKEKLEEIKNNKYTDLHQDSIKNVKSLINSNDKVKEDKSVEYITKWANVMMNKSRYSEEELELVDLLRQMIDCVDEKSRM